MYKIRMHIGKVIDVDTGMMMDGEDTVMSSVLFYYVDRDTAIRIKDRAYAYAYAFYTTRWQEDYIYSYAYQREQNWSDYEKRLSAIGRGYTQEETRFGQEGYIRLSLRRVDGASLTKADLNMEQILAFESGKQTTHILTKPDVLREIKKCIDIVQRYRSESSLVFTLLADSHVTVIMFWINRIRMEG